MSIVNLKCVCQQTVIQCQLKCVYLLNTCWYYFIKTT